MKRHRSTPPLLTGQRKKAKLTRTQSNANIRQAIIRTKENKWYAYQHPQTLMSNTWTLLNSDTTPVNGIPVTTGATDSDTTRNGRQVMMSSFHAKFSLVNEYVNETTNQFLQLDGTQQVRIVAVMDSIVTGTTSPSVSDVYDNEGGNVTDAALQFRNLLNTSRYKVLFDKTIQLTNRNLAAASAGNGDPKTFFSQQTTQVVSINKKFKTPIILEYKNNTNTYASMQKNSITIFACKLTTGSKVKLAGVYRTRFYEY